MYYYYFDDITRYIDIDFDNTLLEENSYTNKYENFLIYDI